MADCASLNLLFHLVRQLKESRVLLLGTYRPDDVTLGRGGERHPLEPILNELKRYYGEIVIDLGAARTHVVWGQALQRRGNPQAAREQFEKAAVQFQTSGLLHELERTQRLIASLIA